jgi:UPF0755 protein
MKRLLIFALVLLLLAGGYVYLALFHPYQGFSAEGVFVDIPHGASQRTIARMLAENGVVRSRLAFEALSRYHKRSRLEAGEYFFNHPGTPFEVFDTIANGRVYVKEFVVPEGFSMFDIANLAQSEGFLTREEFLDAARDTSLIHDIAPAAPTLEGFLFPATYEFPRHISGKDMASAMVKRFRQVWSTLPAAAPTVDTSTPSVNVEKVITLASLVERETPRADERPHVAGVFENRLRVGQPLQCDPTVAYALQLAGKYNGKLDGGDLRFPSPYNTYENRGLPPGPIANPGEAAIRAALDPPATSDFYFVANTEGGHFFAKTLDEHNRNVTQYRHLLQQEQGPPANAGVGMHSRSSAPSPARPQ